MYYFKLVLRFHDIMTEESPWYTITQQLHEKNRKATNIKIKINMMKTLFSIHTNNI